MTTRVQKTTNNKRADNGRQTLELLPKVPNFIMDEKGKYKSRRPLTEDQIIKAAKTLLKRRFKKGFVFQSPDVARPYLVSQYAELDYEVFVCLFLNNQNELISSEEMFRGTIDGASIYPREVVKRALELNAAAVIFAHNHPSGVVVPSMADQSITEKLKNALNLVDIQVLDHFIVGGAWTYSFAEHGLL